MQLTMTINLMSSKDDDEGCAMHSKRDNIEIVVNDKGDEIIEEHFQSLLSRYEVGCNES